jgi:hypothetical protein
MHILYATLKSFVEQASLIKSGKSDLIFMSRLTILIQYESKLNSQHNAQDNSQRT